MMHYCGQQYLPIDSVLLHQEEVSSSPLASEADTSPLDEIGDEEVSIIDCLLKVLKVLLI